MTLSLLSLRTSRPLPKDILPHLPRTGFGQLRNHLHLPRHHEPRHLWVLLHPHNHILTTQRLPFLHRDESLGTFAPVRVLDGYDAGFEDIRVRGENGFQSDGGDVFAA